MKVIGLTGSPRGKNSSTLRLVEAAIEGAGQSGAEVEIIDITRFRINYCKGCGVCYDRGRCRQDDDFEYILNKIFGADGIVLGSPNYVDSVPAQVRTLMDRMGDARHCQMLDGKYAFSVSTTGSSGEEYVLRYMNDFLMNSGAFITGSVGASIGTCPSSINDAAEKACELGKDLVKAILEKRSYPEQEAVHMAFRKSFASTIRANKEKWAHDYLYWAQKGWV